MKSEWKMKPFVKSLNSFRIIAVGLTGSGKTYFLRKLLSKLQIYKKHRIFVADTKYEFDKIKPFTRLSLSHDTFTRKIAKLKIDGTELNNPAHKAGFCCSMAWNFAPATAYLEEIEEIVDVNAHLPVSHPLIYKVLQQGRAKRACLIVAGQMLSRIHKSLIRQSSDIFIFAVKNKEARDIETILSLEPKSLKFDLPTRKEKQAGELKDLYSFYHITALEKPIFYKPI